MQKLLSVIDEGEFNRILFVQIDQWSNYFQLVDSNDYEKHFHVHEPYWEDSYPDGFEENKEVYYSSSTYQYNIVELEASVLRDLLKKYIEWQITEDEDNEVSLREYLNEEIGEDFDSYFGFDFEIQTINPQKITTQLTTGTDCNLLEDDIIIDYDMSEIGSSGDECFILVDNRRFDLSE